MGLYNTSRLFPYKIMLRINYIVYHHQLPPNNAAWSDEWILRFDDTFIKFFKVNKIFLYLIYLSLSLPLCLCDKGTNNETKLKTEGCKRDLFPTTYSNVQQLPDSLVVSGSTISHRQRVHATSSKNRVLIGAKGSNQRISFL